MRHAKSSWEHHVSDFDRPLKGRGTKDAQLISNYVRDKMDLPDLILSSDANRARSTAEIFRDNFGSNEFAIKLVHDLYDFSGEQLLRVIKNCEDSVQDLMIFGHNYAITDFVNTFGSDYFDNVPTAGLVIIRFDIDSWSDLNKGQTVFKIFPKELK